MSQLQPLVLRVNENLFLDAGSWQDMTDEDQRPYRLILPPQQSMYHQVLSYLEHVTSNRKAPPKSQLHFGEVAWATVSVCLRWGSYLAVLLNQHPIQWPYASDPDVSCVGDDEMMRINIEASAALAEWIDLMSKDNSRFRKMVKAAIEWLPLPVSEIDGSTYSERFRAFSSMNSVGGRRFLMECLERDLGQWLEERKQLVLANPVRALANGMLNEHWRNGSEIENIHAGRKGPSRPLRQRRLTLEQEKILMQETTELFVPTMRALYKITTKPTEETWPQQIIPLALIFKPPFDWTLEEETCQIVIPDTEPEGF